MEMFAGGKRGRTAVFLFILLLFTPCRDGLSRDTVKTGDCVILLHGLARTNRSMEEMEEALAGENYRVINVDYPSTEFPVETLAETVIPKALEQCRAHPVKAVHFVTHSLGGILVRYYLSKNALPELGRAVMLSPPNQGSEVVNKLRDLPWFYLINGPAGEQLGVDDESIPLQLGPVNFDLGVITGSGSINPILSLIIPGEDDGKVSVERAKVEGMNDFLVVDHSHTFIMSADDVIEQTLFYLEHGRFRR